MLSTEIDLTPADEKFKSVLQVLGRNPSLMQQIAQTLEHEAEANFAAQGRPEWTDLASSTKAARLKRNKGSSVLQILSDRGTLGASLSTGYGDNFALVGAGGAAKDYAAIQQIGGDIEIPAQSRKIRLRTDRKGNLLRQGDEGKKKNLAVFAKESHKLARESWSEVPAHGIHIPARPYLPFTGTPDAPLIQPEAEKSVLELISTAAVTALR
ncbi:MAG: phage virion morphogenesis protein [Sulfuricellaceae bacterium]